ncbi:uncharacterized protein PHACADRAFT_253025 [Phanerochaete carnosa HHB-10118-sp]|uniref:AIG1-type G domain-containing protein n=1 Tax=Phanerochaete carnosa (strain HHB-10118-sp) TaxID=650164 RepID=K5X6R5_PHACS|nr:uncharacterized protein PHACADRAFT_253025 [Phanerochaete carnosa HHB-10118-sp]EKM58577.1 hypothetical protein PHACADRAFT_253025 [Phanerochaete carnosa HHB-10118-sp]
MGTSADSKVSKTDSATIVVMGATGAGKSTFINLVSNSKFEVGYGLESCTSEVDVAAPFMLDGKPVTLIDTPGFDDTVKTEAEILRLIAEFLSVTYKQGRTLHGIVFLQRITDTRMGGVARKNFRLFRKLCGDDTLRNVIIATNMWGNVEPALGASREREMAESDLFFKPALEKGAHMVRHDNTIESAHRIIREIIGFPPAPLQIQRETVDQRKPLAETGAGQDLRADLEQQAGQHRAELAGLRSSIQELVESKDARNRGEIQELNDSLRDVQTKLAKVQAEAHNLREEHEASRNEHEEKIRQMTEVMTVRETELRGLQEHAQTQKTQLVQMESALHEAERRAEEATTAAAAAAKQRPPPRPRSRSRGGLCILQ